MMLVAAIMGCGGGAVGGTAPVAAEPVLTAVAVSLAFDTLVVGQSLTALARGLDQNRGTVNIAAPVWSTTSPAVATVNQSGVVEAIAPGTTLVIASVGGKQGQRLITVVVPPIARIGLTPALGRVTRGGTMQFSASAFDADNHALSGRPIVFATSDVTHATVSADGLVTALAAGVVTITAMGERVTASSVLTVTAIPDSVATIGVSASVASLRVGGTVQLAATLNDDQGRILLGGRTVTWSVTGVSGNNPATVSSTGLVTARAPGTVILDATCEGVHGSVTLIIADDLDPTIVVSFAGPAENQIVGDTLQVLVGVKSAQSLALVTASVGTLKTTLKLTRVGALGLNVLWVGMIDITDLPKGSYQVLATATNVTGARGAGSRQFLRDARQGKGGSGDQTKQK